MDNLPMKKSVQYPIHTNAKLTKEIGESLDLLDKSGIDVGELKRAAITAAVKQAVQKLNKTAS